MMRQHRPLCNQWLAEDHSPAFPADIFPEIARLLLVLFLPASELIYSELYFVSPRPKLFA